MYDEVTEAFYSLSDHPSTAALTNAIPVLERQTVLMYDRSSLCTTVNTAHKDLFTRKGRDIDAIPPTANALIKPGGRSAELVHPYRENTLSAEGAN